ncbi:MAG: radical SAM protein [Lachnospiraceae bacterium]|nr:radical SAM protein [Lachnospiraceae bacterium]
MIINPSSGTTLCVEKKVADDLAEGKISDDLAFVLTQRAMAEYEGARPVREEALEANPSFFLIDITKSCNLNCVYCFRELSRSSHQMTDEMLDRIVNSISDHALRNSGQMIGVQVWGGEPLLRADRIKRIKQIFNERKVTVDLSIETNGTLITDEIAVMLKENDIRVGISIDGDAFIQNRQRPFADGTDSYNSVLRGIKALKDAGVEDFGTITVVTSHTLDRIEDILDHMVKELKILHLKFNIMREIGENRTFSISEDRIGEYLDRLIRKIKELYDEGYSVSESNIRQKIRNLLIRANDNICDARGCQGGYRMISVDADGKVYPCELTDVEEFVIGDIPVDKDADFDKMVEDASNKKEGYFAERDNAECRDCPWWYYCRGGCRSAAYFKLGSVRPVDPVTCRFNKELYPRIVELILDEPEFASSMM